MRRDPFRIFPNCVSVSEVVWLGEPGFVLCPVVGMERPATGRVSPAEDDETLAAIRSRDEPGSRVVKAV